MSRFHLIVLSSILMLMPVSTANGIVIRHDVDDENYVATIEDFPPLATLYKIGVHGTLISPRWVVTAGHAVFCMEPGDTIKIGAETAEIAGRYVYPEHQLGGRHDLALLRLVEPVNGIEPAKVYESKDEEGQSVWFVGVGGTGNGKDGMTADVGEHDGKLRKAQNTVERVNGWDIFFTFDQGAGALPLEGVSGNGDSGGPAYVETEDGYSLLGISSRADGADIGVYGVTEVYTRVSTYAGWIKDMIAASEEERAEIASLDRYLHDGMEGRIDQICDRVGF